MGWRGKGILCWEINFAEGSGLQASLLVLLPALIP